MIPESPFKEWIQEHKACWEVVPLYALYDEKKTQVGFELHLFAQHMDSVKANPGCEKCQEIFLTLKKIADIVMPTEIRPTRYDVLPFDASFHIRPENRLRTEIQLTLQIVHRQGYFDPLDECEQKCLTEMKNNLEGLGVQQKIWRDKIP